VQTQSVSASPSLVALPTTFITTLTSQPIRQSVKHRAGH